ncbi:MAG: DegT/DnrJ/EryC1/StrS family aminotransferase, partial [Gaiellales bacterium]
AALGLSQMERIDEYVTRRNEIADRYTKALSGLPLRLPTVESENVSAFHLYVIRLRLDEIAATHRQVYDGLRERGIGANLHYLPVHLQPYYRDLGFGDGYCPEAEAYGNDALTIPLFPLLTEEDQDRVIHALEETVVG